MIVHAYRRAVHALRDVGVASKRSPHWASLEKKFIESNPACAACGGKTNVNVHHKIPFHLRPELELDPDNLITLCMSKNNHCHLVLGHGGNFKSFNPEIVKDSNDYLLAKNAGEPHVLEAIVARARLNRRDA